MRMTDVKLKLYDLNMWLCGGEAAIPEYAEYWIIYTY